MITERHRIFIREISLEESQRIKSRQKLKPTTTTKQDTIFGVILKDISYSIGNFTRQVDENLGSFSQINRLLQRKKRNGKIAFKREEIYLDSGNIHEKRYSGISELEKMIREGGGLDLIFKSESLIYEEGERNESDSEIHFYKLRGDNVLLVEVRIPSRLINQGLYRLTRTTNKGYLMLKATINEPQLRR